MHILLVNISHPSIGSRTFADHLPPLGLLAIAGPLIDDGHRLELINGDRINMPVDELVARAIQKSPDAILFGHSGSSTAQPIISEVARLVVTAMPDVKIIYGGVHPTYFWREILRSEPYVHAIVRGEGEETTRRLIAAIENNDNLETVDGIAFHGQDGPVATKPATIIRNLDDYRIGWELIDHKQYSYWGGMRAVLVQFSRGCPHMCTYCGQRGFWTKWRHRDPVLFAAELARLYREEGIRCINFADENPAVSKKAWRKFLEALIAENVDLTLVGSMRADDIVRDADILHLYKKAGFIRLLLGIEHTDDATLKRIKKGATTTSDREAIRLLRKHGIISLATWVVGFEEERDRDYWHGLRQLLSYDPDQISLLYVTPYRWTPFYKEAMDRKVIQGDRTKWDYKHQVLATRHMTPLRGLMWFKFTEMVLQCRPKAIYRTYLQPDRDKRHAMRWYAQIGRRVWPHEIISFFRNKLLKNGPTLARFWGAPQHREEKAMALNAARYEHSA